MVFSGSQWHSNERYMLTWFSQWLPLSERCQCFGTVILQHLRNPNLLDELYREVENIGLLECLLKNDMLKRDIISVAYHGMESKRSHTIRVNGLINM